MKKFNRFAYVIGIGGLLLAEAVMIYGFYLDHRADVICAERGIDGYDHTWSYDRRVWCKADKYPKQLTLVE